MDLFGGAEAVHGDQHAPVGEQFAKRCRLGFVQLQPASDCFRRVVGPAPVQHPAGHDLVRHIKIDGPLNGVRREQPKQAVGLGLGSRKPVEQEARLGVGFSKPLGHDAQDQLVADQLACVHHFFHLAPELRAGGHRSPKHVARRDVRHAVTLDEELALCALAGSLLAQNDQSPRRHQARNPS